LLGDVGLTNVNYANWGLSADGKPVCIDYAYIFPVSMDLFKCVSCGRKTMAINSSFTEYTCTYCKHVYQDRELRSKISQAERLKLFQNVKGIEMKEPTELHEIDQQYIPIDNNPDLPDPYMTAVNSAYHLLADGKISSFFDD
jgi:DNA-directed RNA polymerase subunit RPC12/RpoP